MKKRPAHLSARVFVYFGTAYRRALDSEHCTHGLYAPLSGTPAILAVPRVISLLG